jgi:cell division protein ZapE
VDKLYDNAVGFAATGQGGLGELFPAEWLSGSYGKKFSRCLSRMEEMLGERRAGAEPRSPGQSD